VNLDHPILTPLFFPARMAVKATVIDMVE